MGVGPYMTCPPLISQARWLPRLTHAAADDPHGVAADWTVAAATAGVNTAHPTAAVSDIAACRKKPIAETPLGRCTQRTTAVSHAIGSAVTACDFHRGTRNHAHERSRIGTPRLPSATWSIRDPIQG